MMYKMFIILGIYINKKPQLNFKLIIEKPLSQFNWTGVIVKYLEVTCTLFACPPDIEALSF
jgi:hypothetical protein